MDPGDPGIRTVGVLGVGTMGAGIVQLAAQTGHEVIACDSEVEAQGATVLLRALPILFCIAAWAACAAVILAAF